MSVRNPSRAARSAARAKSAGVRAVANRPRFMLAYSSTLSLGGAPRKRPRLSPSRAARSCAAAVRSPLTAVAAAMSDRSSARLIPSSDSTRDSSDASSDDSSAASPLSASAARRDSPPSVISTTVVFPSPSENTANVHVVLGVGATDANLSREIFTVRRLLYND